MRYPLAGPVRVNSPYGMRDSGFHYGVDLYAMPGTPAYAVDSGQVFYTAFESAGGNHLAMYVDHPPVPEAPKAGYMHLDRFAVGPGTWVKEGDVIGWTDTTGAVTGPHLHFWIGTNANTGAIDPMPFITETPQNPAPPVVWIDSNLALDFSWTHPPVSQLIEARVACILFYSRVSTPPRDYLDECMAFGIGVCPIFETAATRAWDGFDAGRADGDAARGDLERVGVPDGVRLWVNMSDTPSVPQDALNRIVDYAQGFAQTFPDRWALGSYGPLDALRASQAGSARFDALWAVETWGSPRGTVDDHWNFWQQQPGVALVQMANVAPPIAGTDTDWIINRDALKSWGGPHTAVPIPDLSFLFREDDSVFAWSSDEPGPLSFYKSGMLYELTPYTVRECPDQAAGGILGAQKVSGATLTQMIVARWTVAKALNIPITD